MATVFTRILHGEIPGRLIWTDSVCFAMLDIRPLHRGHVLVIPTAEVDQWIDLPEETTTHLMNVAHRIGTAQRATIGCDRVGLMIAGFEVPHTHVHVVPIETMGDLDFSNAEVSPQAADLDTVAELLRSALRTAGHEEFVAAG